ELVRAESRKVGVDDAQVRRGVRRPDRARSGVQDTVETVGSGTAGAAGAGRRRFGQRPHPVTAGLRGGGGVRGDHGHGFDGVGGGEGAQRVVEHGQDEATAARVADGRRQATLRAGEVLDRDEHVHTGAGTGARGHDVDPASAAGSAPQPWGRGRYRRWRRARAGTAAGGVSARPYTFTEAIGEELLGGYSSRDG